jgi:hypothetical protein
VVSDSAYAKASTDATLIAGRYRIETLLGKGGMGSVYAAVDVASGKRVAIKRTHARAAASVLELFKREFHTLHGLRHPNIIEVYDYGTDSTGPFYTMELLEGGDLRKATPLPWPQVCSYLRQVAMLLGLLHARRLLHRDISPSNLWVLPDSRLKLIDFGALSAFGVPTEVVGTPPFIAPESLRERSAAVSIDQRADLYALGALGYWLLTSAHAFPAKSLGELPRAWAREPAPPSQLATLVSNRELPPIPSELDALIASLLRRDPLARPQTTEELIARLDSIAGPASEPVDHALRGYVRSKAFVGRLAERETIAKYLRGLHSRGHAVLIEAAAGIGRSRMLEELSVLGRLEGAASVLVRAGEQVRAYTVANAIALALLDQLPSEALATSKPYAAALARLSPEVHSKLGVLARPAPDETSAGREQLQHALSQWVTELAERRAILLLVDDFENTDEESAAWLAALARGAAARHMLLVAAQRIEPRSRAALNQQIFRNAAQVMTLPALTSLEMHDLLRSVFGDAGYLARVVETLHRVSQGNPAHCLELVEHLIERGLARYSEGSWTLPGQLSAAGLPQTRTEMHTARLDWVGTQARRLAELLSIYDGPLSRAACYAVSDVSEQSTADALVELTLNGVLLESEQGYNLVHDGVRESLSRALEPARRKAAHARLGAVLLASAADPIDAMRAGLHLFRAGDTRRCQQLVQQAALHLFNGHRARLHVAVPLFEQAVELYRMHDVPAETLAVPLYALCMASFFVDRRLADRYGGATLAAFEDLLMFGLARKLRRFIGAKLALLVALTLAGARLRASRAVAPSLADALRMHLSSVVAQNAVATSSFDLAGTERCRHALEPLAAFSDRHIAGFIRRCVLAIANMIRDDHVGALAELCALIALADSKTPIRNLPVHLKQEFVGGGLFSIGVLLTWKQDPAVLAIVDRMEQLGPMHALTADHLRAAHYAGLGDMSRAAQYRHQLETRALRVGAAWQVVTMGPVHAQVTALWTNDALMAKRAAAELERLSRELPSLTIEARRARSTYLVLCGRYREAIDTLRDEGARNSAGWLRARGMLARAHNRLGEHARARELCREALANRSDAELMFVVMNLHVQLELALADAALGDLEPARARIDVLLARHAKSAGPLALGAIHETAARIALLAADFAGCRAQLEGMRSYYVPTQITSLLELTESLAQKLAQAERGEIEQATGPSVLLDDDAHLITRMRLILTSTEATFEQRARRSIELALELTGADHGFVIALDAPVETVQASHDPPPAGLVDWVRARLSLTGDEETAIGDGDSEEQGTVLLDGVRYCLTPLSAPGAAAAVSAALVLGFGAGQPLALRADVLGTIARHLFETTARVD